jgi:hypothetical protein
MKASRGNPGYFHGAPLNFLLKHLPLYLSTPPHKKDADFWKIFDPQWDEEYPSLNSDELGELTSEESAYEAEKEAVKRENKRELKRKGRKAKLLRLPLPGDRLCELRARSADRKVRKRNSSIAVWI